MRGAAAAAGAARGGDACMLFFPRNPYVLMCDRVPFRGEAWLAASSADRRPPPAQCPPRSLITAN